MFEAAASGASASTASGENGASTSTVSGKRVYVPENKPKPAEQQSQQQAPSYKGTKHRVKVGEQESEIDYDELVRGYQTGRASTQRFQEASTIAKQSQEILKRLETGDIDFIVNRLGPDKAKDLFEQYLISEMEYDALPDSEKRVRELEAENKKLKSLEQRHKDAQAKQQQDAYLARAHQEIDDQVSQALEKVGRKPTPRLVLRIVDDMIARLGDDGSQWDAESASKMAIQSVHQDIAEFLTDLSPQELVQILPEQVLKAIRQHEVAQVMDGRSKVRVKATDKPAQKSAKGRTLAEAFKDIETRFTR